MQARPAPISADDYLRMEERNPRKSEYVNGEIYGMSGANRRHNVICTNMLRHAANASVGRPGCQAFGPDMKLRIAGANCFYYPDLSVTCDPTDNHEAYLVRPCFIAEVLSPSTARIDRREKRGHYLTLRSLRDYAMIDQNRMRIELCRREGGGWREYLLDQPEDVLESSCLDLRLTLAQIYDGVEPPGYFVKEATAAYEAFEPSYY